MKLVKYDAACKALAAARSVDEAKVIKDKAEAIRAYARQAKNPKLEADAWEIRKRAEDRLGALSAALEKSKGGGDTTRRSGAKSAKALKTKALKNAGISKDQASRYERFHRLPTEEKEKRIARGRAAIEAGRTLAESIAREGDKAERRANQERELAVSIRELPQQRFGVIYADPPWRFQPYSRQTGMDRSADNQYPTMELDKIKNLSLPAARDCVLFLWATAPMLPQALEVMKSWDFEYKTHFVWGKDQIGTGYWTRNKHELLLIGTRGNIPAPAPGKQFESLIMAPKGRHSAKPEQFRRMIEAMFPSLPKLEMFARTQSPGWEAWGNEAGEQDAA